MNEGVKHNVYNEVAMQSIEAHNDTPVTAGLRNLLMKPTLKRRSRGPPLWKTNTQMSHVVHLLITWSQIFGAKTTPRPPRIVSFTIEKQWFLVFDRMCAMPLQCNTRMHTRWAHWVPFCRINMFCYIKNKDDRPTRWILGAKFGKIKVHRSTVTWPHHRNSLEK